jgi:hypothetical protein
MDTADLVASTYDAHQRELYSFALRSTRDPEVAEDVLQEAFTRLIVEVEAGRTPDNIRAWLYRVIANLIASGAGDGRSPALGALVSDDIDAGPSRVPRPGAPFGSRGRPRRARRGERIALVMAANGFKGIEIADAIGRSSSATRTMMCRSRVHLRQRLGSMGSWGRRHDRPRRGAPSRQPPSTSTCRRRTTSASSRIWSDAIRAGFAEDLDTDARAIAAMTSEDAPVAPCQDPRGCPEHRRADDRAACRGDAGLRHRAASDLDPAPVPRSLALTAAAAVVVASSAGCSSGDRPRVGLRTSQGLAGASASTTPTGSAATGPRSPPSNRARGWQPARGHRSPT